MTNISSKSRLALVLLAWFLGVFGAHRFYAGKTGSAVAQLILTISVVGLIVSAVWAFVDLIMAAAGKFEDSDGLLIEKW